MAAISTASTLTPHEARLTGCFVRLEHHAAAALARLAFLARHRQSPSDHRGFGKVAKPLTSFFA
jgi:hypothetical protein